MSELDKFVGYLAGVERDTKEVETKIVYGTVKTTNPLVVMYGNLPLTKEFVEYPKVVNLAVGDKLTMLKTNRSQRFYVLENNTQAIPYYTKAEVDNLLANIDSQLANSFYTKTVADARFAPIVHNHDSAYYTKSQVYTKGESDANFSVTSHNHSSTYLPLTGGTITGATNIKIFKADVITGTDIEVQAAMDNAGASVGNGEGYQRYLFDITGNTMGGGAWWIRGWKTDTNYEHQIATSYAYNGGWPMRRRERSKVAGTWGLWHYDTGNFTPALTNGWVRYNSAFANAFYGKNADGIVTLGGLIRDGAISSACFTLPVGYRPSETLIFITQSNGSQGRVDVYPSGAVLPEAPTSNAYLSLAGISFLAQG